MLAERRQARGEFGVGLVPEPRRLLERCNTLLEVGASPSLDTSATESNAPPRFSSAASGANFACSALIAAVCSILGGL